MPPIHPLSQLWFQSRIHALALRSVLGVLGLACHPTERAAQFDSTPDPMVVLEVQPEQTSPEYATSEPPHCVVFPPGRTINTVVLFIGGSFSKPKDYARFCIHAASLGWGVISLAYPNEVPTAPLGSRAEPNVFADYRQELCFGSPVSTAVAIDSTQSIVTRATKLLQYLHRTYRHQGWSKHLDAAGLISWRHLRLAGHSQGAGHAAYLGKKHQVERVVLFSGPNDYSTYFGRPAPWLNELGATPASRYFALLHRHDEVVPYPQQVANLQALGLLSPAELPASADVLAKPFGYAQALSITSLARSNHSAPVGANPILPTIWTYLLAGY